MKKWKYPSNPILRNYIDHISYNVSIPNENKFIPIMPDGMTELVINFSNSYERRSGDNEKIEEVKSSHFVGIKSRQHYIRTNNSRTTICVRFKPGAVSLFTNLNMNELTDNVVSAEDIFSNEFSELEDRIENLNDLDKKFIEIEKFMLLKLSQNQKALQSLDIVKMIYNNPAISRIELVKEKTGLGYKNIERNFQKYIGIQPKHFMKIVRFNFATKLMHEFPKKSLTEIALESGYFDQSHFIKTFKLFSGQIPKNFMPYDSSWIETNQQIINRQFSFHNN